MKKPVKRYTLVLPMTLWDQVEHMAKERQTTVLEILRKFIRLGLLVTDSTTPCEVIIRRDGKDIHPIFL